MTQLILVWCLFSLTLTLSAGANLQSPLSREWGERAL